MNEAEGGSRQGTGASPACDEVREQLPLLLARRSAASGRPSVPGPDAPVQAHLDTCPACAEEVRFLEQLVRARPDPPTDLAARVVARALLPTSATSEAPASSGSAVIPFRPRSHRPSPSRWWTSPAAAAAVVVLAAGLGLVARELTTGVDGSRTLAAFDASSADWWAEEWLVAGAPYLEGISDETLVLLAAGIEP